MREGFFGGGGGGLGEGFDDGNLIFKTCNVGQYTIIKCVSLIYVEL